MDGYTAFLYFIIVVKVFYSMSVLLQLTEVLHWSFIPTQIYTINQANQTRFENLYIFLMSLMMFRVFRNRRSFAYRFRKLELELLYIFSIILISQLVVSWYQTYINKENDDAVKTTTEMIVPFV